MSTGRERFVASLTRLRTERMPETARRWKALPEGFRVLIHKQAGVTFKPLEDLTDLQREKLYQANQRVFELSERARSILVAAFMPKV